MNFQARPKNMFYNNFEEINSLAANGLSVQPVSPVSPHVYPRYIYNEAINYANSAKNYPTTNCTTGRIHHLLAIEDQLSRKLKSLYSNSNNYDNLYSILKLLMDLQKNIEYLIEGNIDNNNNMPVETNNYTYSRPSFALPPISKITDDLQHYGTPQNYVVPAQVAKLQPMAKKKKAFTKPKKTITKKLHLPQKDPLVDNIAVPTAAKTLRCGQCKDTDTPEWRRGPYGSKTLCNACGLYFSKLIKRFGVKDANLLMRFKNFSYSADRKIPQLLDIPQTFIHLLENDHSLDCNYFTKKCIKQETSDLQIS